MTSSVNYESQTPSDSDTLHINVSWMVLRIFGFCLTSAGVLLLALSLFVLMLGRAGAISFAAMFAFGLLFILAGLATSEKTIVVVDKRDDSLTITSKWPGWQKSESHSLSDFRGIAIVRDWNRSRHGARKLYRIVIERSAEHGDWVCLVDPAGSALAARSLASRLAQFANLPMRVVDHTSPSAV